MGKKSIPQITVEQELQRQKGKRGSRDDESWINWATQGNKGQQRLSNEATASKGVYQIATGPRGSGIREVRTSAEGTERQPHREEKTMSKEEFEVKLLTG